MTFTWNLLKHSPVHLALFSLLLEELVSVYYNHHHHIIANTFLLAAFPNFQNDMKEKEKFPRAVILGFSGTYKVGEKRLFSDKNRHRRFLT